MPVHADRAALINDERPFASLIAWPGRRHRRAQRRRAVEEDVARAVVRQLKCAAQHRHGVVGDGVLAQHGLHPHVAVLVPDGQAVGVGRDVHVVAVSGRARVARGRQVAVAVERGGHAAVVNSHPIPGLVSQHGRLGHGGDHALPGSAPGRIGDIPGQVERAAPFVSLVVTLVIDAQVLVLVRVARYASGVVLIVHPPRSISGVFLIEIRGGDEGVRPGVAGGVDLCYRTVAVIVIARVGLAQPTAYVGGGVALPFDLTPAVVINIAAEHDGDGSLLVLIGLVPHVGKALIGGVHPRRGAHLLELAAKVENHGVAVILELALDQHGPVLLTVAFKLDVLPRVAAGRARVDLRQSDLGLIGDLHIPRGLVVVVAEVVSEPYDAIGPALFKPGDVHIALFLAGVLDGKAHFLHALAPAGDLVRGPQLHAEAIVVLYHELHVVVGQIQELIVAPGLDADGIHVVEPAHIGQRARGHERRYQAHGQQYR